MLLIAIFECKETREKIIGHLALLSIPLVDWTIGLDYLVIYVGENPIWYIQDVFQVVEDRLIIVYSYMRSCIHGLWSYKQKLLRVLQWLESYLMYWGYTEQ